MRPTALLSRDSWPVSAWERWSQWPLIFFSLVFLGAYAWPILEPDLSRGAVAACNAVILGTWALFAVDYVVRFLGADRRGRWVLHHLLDLFILALPLLRPLQLLRLLLLVRVLNRTAAGTLRGKVGLYVALGSMLLALTAALAVLDAERGVPDASITSFADAMWWSLTTMTTVGYGDTYPVTGAGRWVGAGLMVTGVALLGTVTATLASWLVDRITGENEQADAAERAEDERADEARDAETAALRREVTALREQLAVLIDRLPAPPVGTDPGPGSRTGEEPPA
ncbi:potassium channel family protein [Nocardioides bruguierae]|uniref:Potassium channel family protein n=1 Tax=Nocardioides bruguierae TaxID=2945102 RepID=A0A9X2IF54_9ACTN|nr:potassium channel family protein [Nocardioides bruguierae]MCM0619345.1 potassium channel family protein [Nocardioides bruguierae]